MAAFPELSSVPYGSPVTKSIEFLTLVHEFESGVITRKQKRTYPLRSFSLTYPKIKVADAQTLYQFFIARAGGFEDFVFFDRNATNAYVKEYVGTGNGVDTVWNLPSLNASSYTLYIDDVAKTAGVDWTFGQAGGSDGEDKMTYGSAVTNGARITFSFTGRLKVRCIFKESTMSWEEFYSKLVTTGLSLRGLLNS